MLGKNIKVLRKKKGYSQATLAEQLNVVRQTISKWEKGLSVPDAEMLERIASQFEVSVDELLGNNIQSDYEFSDIAEIAKQLAILNEQLVKQSRGRRRFWKIVLISIAVFLLSSTICSVFAFSLFKSNQSTGVVTTVELYCTLDGEEYTYEITYDEQYQVISAGGNAWISNHVQTEQYGDANILMAQIEDYFISRGGTCEIR